MAPDRAMNKTSFPSISILGRMLRARFNFLVLTGLEPKVFYLGKKEFREFSKLAKASCTKDDATCQGPSFSEIPVMEVKSSEYLVASW